MFAPRDTPGGGVRLMPNRLAPDDAGATVAHPGACHGPSGGTWVRHERRAATAATHLWSSAMSDLRSALVSVARAWQERFGVAPHITNAIAEYDAALLVGMTEEEYALDCRGRTAVTAGFDFTHHGVRYQVKANRPSGLKGSKVTLVSAAKNYDWDR